MLNLNKDPQILYSKPVKYYFVSQGCFSQITWQNSDYLSQPQNQGVL